jgi:hypothetical protein
VVTKRKPDTKSKGFSQRLANAFVKSAVVYQLAPDSNTNPEKIHDKSAGKNIAKPGASIYQDLPNNPHP